MEENGYYSLVLAAMVTGTTVLASMVLAVATGTGETVLAASELGASIVAAFSGCMRAWKKYQRNCKQNVRKLIIKG